MLFRRRKAADFGEKLRTMFWPRRSFARSARYFSKRVLRLTATPHAVAAGVAAGAFASFLPYLGFHFVIAGVLAWLLRGNLIASALGTAVGNPITFPFIWGCSLGLGRYVLDGSEPGQLKPLELGRVLWELDFALLWQPFLKPMTVGGAMLGALCGLILYLVTYWAVGVFREQRRRRLADRARERAHFMPGQTAR
ncbi:MAG: DUF2062 domain-containing protein [Rhizobiaceae bacterium]|nr:DUF2062 domain-containing protein [Rhizobiaceae bacterium]